MCVGGGGEQAEGSEAAADREGEPWVTSVWWARCVAHTGHLDTEAGGQLGVEGVWDM